MIALLGLISRHDKSPTSRSSEAVPCSSRQLNSLEDKVAQRAIVMVLEAVYEQDFLPCVKMQLVHSRHPRAGEEAV